MGSADRTYMRERELPTGWTAWAWASRISLFAVVAFVAWHIAADELPHDVPRWTLLDARALPGGRWWTPLTTAFAPSGVGDAAFTLFGFWFFGRAVEREIGTRRFLALAATAVVIPHLVFAAVAFGTDAPHVARGFAGVAAGMAAFAAVREPSSGHEFLGFSIQPRWFGVAWLAIAAIAWTGWIDRPDAQMTVELTAAAIGAVGARFALVPGASLLRNWLPSRRPPEPRTLSDAEIRAQVDTLLERISARGMDSLTDAERAFLTEASKRYR